jgi:transposase
VIRQPRGVHVWARAAPTDLRKGFAGLAGLVEAELGHDLVAGDLFIFKSGSRRLVKVQRWDRTGPALYSKRLARGCFAEVWRCREGEPIALSRRVFEQLLQGADVTRSREWR